MKSQITAAELLAQLNADPAYVARKRQQDEHFRRLREEYDRAQEPLIDELRTAQVPVKSVWDLVNQRNVYPQSLPILLEHLRRPYPDAIRDGIARALAVPDARFAWPSLVAQYRVETGDRTRSGLAVALSNIADDTVMEELIELAGDRNQGVSRVLLLDALRRSHLPQAREALTEFAADPLLVKEARRVLRRLDRRRKR